MFTDSKYTRWYFSIVRRALQTRNLVQIERHHVVPKSCGGADENNLVTLTPREHFVCHRLLAKCLENDVHRKKMVKAFFFMCRNRNANSKTYEHSRAQFIASISGVPRSQETRDKISAKGRARGTNGWAGKTHSPESKKKMSESAKGRKMPPVSDETRRKISEAKKGKTLSLEHRSKLGTKFTEEHRAKLAQARRGRKMSEETKAKIRRALTKSRSSGDLDLNQRG